MYLEKELYQQWSKYCSLILLSQREKLKKLLHTIKKNTDKSRHEALSKQFSEQLASAIQSAEYWVSAKQSLPFDLSLPAFQKKDEIQKALQKHPVVIICGDTGSGKTTQLPLYALEAGFGVNGRIGCTQPRRIAATSVATYVANTLHASVGGVIGYEVRFDKKVSDTCMVKFMTDGILLAETQSDTKLLQYEMLIIDEAHERSLNIDFLLGYLKELLSERSDLKVVISSATLEAQKFSEYFENAPVFFVEGRTFPIEDIYLEEYDDNEDLDELVARSITWISDMDLTGDILVFLPGEKEIFDCERKLRARYHQQSEILPLYARLSAMEQSKIFESCPKRKIVLATNVAETSLTIPGIRYVVDSGVARVNRYNPQLKIQKLQVEWISKSNAKQRRGRCGRIEEGLCYHLYTKEIYEEMAAFPDPEIRRTGLAGVVLQMKKLKLKEIDSFPFIDPPNKKMTQSAYQSLYALGAIDHKNDLTDLGLKLLPYPLDPHLACMILYAVKEDCLHEILVLVSVLSTMDPRERPLNATQENIQKQKKWDYPKSDFFTLLNLWIDLKEQKEKLSNQQFKRFLKEYFISYRKWMEWKNVYNELSIIVKKEQKKIHELRLHYDAVHKSLLAGLPFSVGYLNENEEYHGYGGQEFFIFPGSVLFREKSKWIFCFALMETTKLFARTIAICNPQWLEAIFPHLCKYHYTEAYWNEKQGCPYAVEHVVLKGYSTILKRPVYYGRINPEEAQRIFIEGALVNCNRQYEMAALKYNATIIEKIKHLEVKSRKIHKLYNESALNDFYSSHIPASIHTTKQFRTWYYSQEKENPNFLYVVEEDLLIPQIDESFSPEAYPDSFDLNGHLLDITYRYTPSEENDGFTLICPLSLLSQLMEHHLDSLVPGFFSEKAEELFKTLPKRLRVAMNPASQWVEGFKKYTYHTEKTFIQNLCDYSRDVHHTEVSPADFKLSDIPKYFKAYIAVVDAEQHVLMEGRDLNELKEKLQTKLDANYEEIVDVEIPIKNIRDWQNHRFEKQTKIKTKSYELNGFVGLFKQDKTLSIKVFQYEQEALKEHKHGLVHLFKIENPDLTKYLYSGFPLHSSCMNYFRVLLKNHEKHLEDLLAERVISSALNLEENEIHQPEEFIEAMAAGRSEIVLTAEKLAKVFEECYRLYTEINSILEKCKGTLFAPILKDFHQYLALLFSFDTLSSCSEQFLFSLSKITKSFEVRAQRLLNNPLKDSQKSKSIDVYWKAYESFQDVLSSQKKDKTLENLYVENLLLLHAATFAPEIRLPQKVSTKVMDEILQAVKDKS